jgi:hypothetical protein
MHGREVSMINCNDNYDLFLKNHGGDPWNSQRQLANWQLTGWDFPQFQDIITCFLFGYAFVEGDLLHYGGA